MKRLLSLIVRGVSGAVRAMGWRACRFYPSCSQYSCEALEHYGAWKGSWLGLGRLLRCHPLSAGGYDPLEKN